MNYTDIIGSTLYRYDNKFCIFEDTSEIHSFLTNIKTIKDNILDKQHNPLLKLGKITNVKGLAKFTFRQNTANNTCSCYHESTNYAFYVNNSIYIISNGHLIFESKINNINSKALLLEGYLLSSYDHPLSYDADIYQNCVNRLNNNIPFFNIEHYDTSIDENTNNFGVNVEAFIEVQFDINQILSLFKDIFNNNTNIFYIFRYDDFLRDPNFSTSLNYFIRNNIANYFDKIQNEHQRFLNQINV